MLAIRPEEPSDVDQVRAVVSAAFPTDAEARLVDALRRAGRLTLSLVAVEDNQVIGHVAFSPVTVGGGGEGVGLAPVAVLRDRQRQGIGASLIQDGLERARALGAAFVVTLGEPHYYSRFGFAPASRWGLSDEYGGGDAFQALELKDGGITATGVVKYAPEFATFDKDSFQ